MVHIYIYGVREDCWSCGCADAVASGWWVKMESGHSGLAPLSTSENKEVHVRATQLCSL